MELTEGLLLIAASGIGAICGILGQSIKDWLSRPRLKIMALADEQTRGVQLFFANVGRKSTEGLALDIVHIDKGILSGEEKTVFHSTDVTIHPKTAYGMMFGHLDEKTLKIKKSDFDKHVKYSDDSGEGQNEWEFSMPAEFYVTACAKDTRAHFKIISIEENGVRIKNPKKVSSSSLGGQSMFREDDAPLPKRGK